MASPDPAPSASSAPLFEPAGADALLARAATCDDPDDAARLREQAVVLMLGLADSLARRYMHRGVDSEDLVQVARMALVKSARGFLPDRGSGFAAYATPTILGELKRHFRDSAWSVRPPRRLQEHQAYLVAEEERLRHALHRSPTSRELAAAVGLSLDEVREAVASSSAYHADSLDAPGPGGAVVRDTLRDGRDAFEALETRATLAALVGELDARDRRLLHLRFVEERTQAEVGRTLGVSQMQVSRLLSCVLARLRDGIVGPLDQPEHDPLLSRRAE